MKYCNGLCYVLNTKTGDIHKEKHFSLNEDQAANDMISDAIDHVRSYINSDHLSEEWKPDYDCSGNELIFVGKHNRELTISFHSDDYDIASTVADAVFNAIVHPSKR